MRKDIDLSFTTHPLTGDLAVRKGVDAIGQSLRNIVLTSYYERGFNTEFGTPVRDTLFELGGGSVEIQGLKQTIRRAIEAFEPQADLIDLQTYVDDNDRLIIKVVYNELNNPVEQEQTIPIPTE